MQIFINEHSLQGQYSTPEEFTEAVRFFRSLFLTIQKIDGSIYKSEVVINYQAIRNEEFQASFNRIKNRDLKIAFRDIIFNRLNPKNWQNDQFHLSDDKFTCQELNNANVTQSSLAEASERKLQNTDLTIILLNFIQSAFSGHSQVNIKKNQSDSVQLPCFEKNDSLLTFIQSLPTYYNLESKDPPRDIQTILRNTERFEVVEGKFYDGRKIYKEKRTNYYWYVDNFHYGESAHLEVFDRHGYHLGEATLNGELDYKLKDTKKSISIR